MRKLKHTTFIVALSTLLFFISCEEDLSMEFESFLIDIDNVILPTKITANVPFEVTLSGTIGPNGCYSFQKFETQKVNNDIIIETWGQLDVNSDVCTQVMVFLDGKKFNYTIVDKGTYKLKFKQPDNTYLEKQITVE